jgi:type II secretory pathway pseudopilin PulG
MRRGRPGYTLFDLLILLAFLLILLGLLLPAVQKVREAAARMKSMNNLRQIALAAHNYESANGHFPSGADGRDFSGLAHLLPYVEQDNLFKTIDMTKGPTDDDNAAARGMRIEIFESPMEGAGRPDEKSGPTSYFLVAGSKHALADNDGVFYRDSKTRITDITDGTSNTVLVIESLRGDGAPMAVSVQRQHVRLKKEDLKGLMDTAGVKDFKDGKNVVANRGAAWIDGRFLQATINLTRGFNDEKPDVDCGGDGGLAGPRWGQPWTLAAMADGSARIVNKGVKLETWKAAATRAGGEVLPADF